MSRPCAVHYRSITPGIVVLPGLAGLRDPPTGCAKNPLIALSGARRFVRDGMLKASSSLRKRSSVTRSSSQF